MKDGFFSTKVRSRFPVDASMRRSSMRTLAMEDLIPLSPTGGEDATWRSDMELVIKAWIPRS